MPPLRPASRASSLVHSCAVPFWWAALPPLLAISRCLARSIDANPRSSLATLSLLALGGSSARRCPIDLYASPTSATAVPHGRAIHPEMLELPRVTDVKMFGNNGEGIAVPKHICAAEIWVFSRRVSDFRTAGPVW